MNLYKPFIHVAAFFLVSLYLPAQARPGEDNLSGDRGTLKPGVVVEAIEKSSDGERAGLQKGDTLLNWNRGSVSGGLESPFDLTRVDIEQRPQGAVTIGGLRNGEPQVWVMGSKYWGITARPNFAEGLLAVYSEGKELAGAGRIAEAAERWRSAAVAAAVQSRQLSAWLLFCTAELLREAQQWKEADDAYQQALAQASASAPRNEAFLLLAWGSSFVGRSDWDNAERHYQQAITESRKWGDENLTARCLTSLGFLEIDRSDLAKAESYLRRAQEIYERIEPDSLEVAPGLLNMGMVAIERGDLAGAEEWERRGLAAFRRLAPHGNGVLVALDNLGEIARRRGEFDRAEEFYLEALEIKVKTAPDSPLVATFLQNLGIVADQRGDLKRAEEYLQRARTLLEKPASGGSNDDGAAGVATVGSTLKYLGDVAVHRGDLEKAEEFFTNALAIKQKVAPESLFVAEILNGLGDVSISRDNLAAAKEYYSHALTIREKFVPGSTYHAETMLALASLAARRQQSRLAEQLFQQALNALESQMAHLGGSTDVRSGFRAGYARYYQDYIDLLIAQKKPELAFQVLERARARGLLETLAAARVDIHKGADPALLRQERALQQSIQAQYGQRIRLLNDKNDKNGEQQLLAADNEIKNLLARYQDVEGQIRSTSPAYAALTQPQPLTPEQVQRELLDAGTVLLEYSLGEERSYVFAVSSESLTAYELPGRTQIEEAARLVYDALTAHSRREKGKTEAQRVLRMGRAETEYPRAAARLSRMILAPVASLIRGKRLLIVSDGILQYVPFAALPIPGGQGAFVPLVVKHEIVTLPSASVLRTLRQQRAMRPRAPKEVMVLADPVFAESDARVKTSTEKRAADAGRSDDSFSRRTMLRSAIEVGAMQGGVQFPRLIFTRREADAILMQTSPGAGRRLVDFQASRATATGPEVAQYRIIHFATHSLLNSEHPELSGLVLSLVDERGQSQDGFLMLPDIYNLDLSADMVVLSACETALGKDIQGEGMVGITRGFMYAGASRVVASLWKVDDAATAELMSRFYRGILREGLQPSVALRKAQVALWKQKRWSFPYYWAGFVMQGE